MTKHQLLGGQVERFGGKRRVRSVENAGCGKCGVWKMRGVENVEQICKMGVTSLHDSPARVLAFKVWLVRVCL